jgi:two-component system NtrC family response regulator
LTPAAESALLNYECKGNVRELEKIIRRAVIMTDETYLKPEDLQLQTTASTQAVVEEESEASFNLAVARNITEKRTIMRALDAVEGNISKAAKLLDVSRPTLYSLIERPVATHVVLCVPEWSVGLTGRASTNQLPEGR